MTKVPVLFCIFNRPEVSVMAFQSIKQYKPDRLYISADGPRPSNKGEVELCEQTRQAVLNEIDWPCDVKTLFRKENLGCAKSMYTGISWFFEQEKWGVIIEDDVIVAQDYFKLCEKLLPRYANEVRIMEISAENHFPESFYFNTYLYSQDFYCWGWATWARAWKRMDMKMTAWPNISIWFLIKKFGLFRGLMMKHYWSGTYNHIETSTSWATRWFFSIIVNNGLCILPGNNLSINIGMDGGAHYEKGDVDPYAYLKLGHLNWPLKYDDNIKPNPIVAKQGKADFRRVRWIGLKKKIRKIF